MFPQQKLKRLATQKAALLRGIARRRVHCAAAAARVAQRLEWLDKIVAICRQLSPLAQFAAVPLGLFVQRAVSPRPKILRTLLRWCPLLFGAIRVATRAVGTRVKPSKSPNDQTP
jgi:hypothetical protein